MDKTSNQILFIINPISGVKRKDNLPDLIKTCLRKKSLPYKIIHTEYAGHAQEIATQGVKDGIKYIVAAGGDGTINEVATSLIGTNSSLGIIPLGSGNGLARHLKIPLNQKKAIDLICSLKVQNIDTAKFNTNTFFCVAGIGFDGLVSHRFAIAEKRGFRSYIKTTLKELKSYEPRHYNLEIDGKSRSAHAFSISIANSSQFGNNAFISPKSSIIDGYLDLCIIKPFPKRVFKLLIMRLFSRSLHLSKYTEYVKCKVITIKQLTRHDFCHIDGDPINTVAEIRIEINPMSLGILQSKKISS